MKKYNLLFVLVYALFVMLPFSVNAATVNSSDEFINALGGSEYAKLVDGEIILQKNIKLTENITLESGAYVLNLNGKMIEDDTNVKNYIIQLDNADLTINDPNGTGLIKSNVNNRTLWVKTNSNLTINNGNFEGNDTIISYKGSSVKINNGNFNPSSTALVCYGGNITINNGTFKTNDKMAIHLATGEDSNETLIINGGNFEGDLGLNHDSGNFIINGGVFKGTKFGIFINLQYLSKSKINEGQFEKGIGLYQDEEIHSPVITVDSGSLYELVPTLLGSSSKIKPDEYINKCEEDHYFDNSLKIFKTKDNLNINRIDIIFDANGGLFKSTNKDIIEINDIISFNYKELEKPTRDGYSFVGFYTEKTNGKSFEEVMNSEAGIEEDTIFYARWMQPSGGGLGIAEPDEENPNTYDGIGTSIFMGTISLIGLIGATIYLKKKNKVRAN